MKPGSKGRGREAQAVLVEVRRRSKARGHPFTAVPLGTLVEGSAVQTKDSIKFISCDERK